MTKTQDTQINAAFLKRVASLIDTIVWADRKAAVEVMNKLTERNISMNVKCLVSMLSEANDEATVKASFALEGLIMEAGNPEGIIFSADVGKALADALPYAKDDYALCVVLEAIRRLAAGKVLKQVAPYLLAKDPVFTYATMCIEALAAWNSPEAVVKVLTAAADDTRDKNKKKLLLGAALHVSRLIYKDSVSELFENDIEQFAPGKLTAKNQTGIMMLDELSQQPEFLDISDIKKALGSNSKIVRGLGQRALLSALSSGRSCSEEFINEAWSVCRYNGSVSTLKSLFAQYLEDECCLQDDILDELSEAIILGDPIMKEAALKMFNKVIPSTAQLEGFIKLALELPESEVGSKVAFLNFMGASKNPVMTVYVMSQLRAKRLEVRQAAEAAARSLGVHPDAIAAMLPPAK